MERENGPLPLALSMNGEGGKTPAQRAFDAMWGTNAP